MKKFLGGLNNLIVILLIACLSLGYARIEFTPPRWMEKTMADISAAVTQVKDRATALLQESSLGENMQWAMERMRMIDQTMEQQRMMEQTMEQQRLMSTGIEFDGFNTDPNLNPMMQQQLFNQMNQFGGMNGMF